MQLSLTQACSSGALLLLLVSNLRLLQNAICTSLDQMSSAYLYNHVAFQSSLNLYRVSSLYREFNQMYAHPNWSKPYQLCHTGSLLTSEIQQRLQHTKDEVILREMTFVSHSWKSTLKYLVLAVTSLPGLNATVLPRAREVEDRNEDIFKAMVAILKKIHPDSPEPVYGPWVGLSYMNSTDEETSYYILFNLMRCLYRDTRNFDNYIKVLKQRDRDRQLDAK